MCNILRGELVIDVVIFSCSNSVRVSFAGASCLQFIMDSLDFPVR
jgi:hypothetical protein